VKDLKGEMAELEEQNRGLLENMASMEMSDDAIIERLMKRFPSLGVEA